MRLIKIIKYINIFFATVFISSLIFCNPDNNEEPVYHSPDALERYLQQVSQTYPEITFLKQIGTTTNGRTIQAICISDIPAASEPEPKIRLTGAIHGNENATTEVLVRLIDYIISKYRNGDSYVKSLVDNRYIVIIPMLNPDGVALHTRENANGIDLNRNFIEAWTLEPDHGSTPFSEPESDSIRAYSESMIFHSSLTFHTGAVIVNMPFDYASDYLGGDIPLENDLVNYLSLEYSRSGRFLESPGLLNTPRVTDGTINGGDWYIAHGTLQDWSYKQTGCIDQTVEIANYRPDTKAELDELFDLNRDSILAYIEASEIGIFGRVTDSSTGEPISAEITVTGGDIITHSDPSGYYHRILLPGTYDIIFSVDGYNDYPDTVIISDETPVLKNITMIHL
jgi:hypothetical protein